MWATKRIAFDLLNVGLFFCIVKQMAITSLVINLRWNDRNHRVRDCSLYFKECPWTPLKIQIPCKRNSVKCDLLQRAVGQITEQAICIFAQYFYFEKYVTIGRLNKMHEYDYSKFLVILKSPFWRTHRNRNLQIWCSKSRGSILV